MIVVGSSNHPKVYVLFLLSYPARGTPADMKLQGYLRHHSLKRWVVFDALEERIRLFHKNRIPFIDKP